MKDQTILGSLDAELTDESVSLAKPAFAQASGLPQDIIDVLNFALTLEYLEDEFYRLGLASGMIPASDLPIFQTISAQESAHVALLQGLLGPSAVAKPTFDFTVGGVFDPLNDYEEFKGLSQGFEDAGVRAYKGQATALIANDDVLTTALRIHSVEARHASAVRRLRGQKGWITGNQVDILELQAVYDGEQAANGPATTPEAAEAFDEPLTRDQALGFADLFIVI
jgi:hypothetical protein